jgi:hypothetical protein
MGLLRLLLGVVDVLPAMREVMDCMLAMNFSRQHLECAGNVNSDTYSGGDLLLLRLISWKLAHDVRVWWQVGVIDGVPFPGVVVVFVRGHDGCDF